MRQLDRNRAPVPGHGCCKGLVRGVGDAEGEMGKDAEMFLVEDMSVRNPTVSVFQRCVLSALPRTISSSRSIDCTYFVK